MSGKAIRPQSGLSRALAGAVNDPTASIKMAKSRIEFFLMVASAFPVNQIGNDLAGFLYE
jgi:uncharacterized membrane protein